MIWYIVRGYLIIRSVHVQRMLQYLSYILRFFAPHGQLVALMGMKFGMTWGAKNQKFYVVVEYKCPTEAYPHVRFVQNFQCLWAVPLWVMFLNLGNLLKGFQSYGSLKLGCIFPPNFQCLLAVKCTLGVKEFWSARMIPTFCITVPSMMGLGLCTPP